MNLIVEFFCWCDELVKKREIEKIKGRRRVR